MTAKMTKELWLEMYKEAGIDKSVASQWHKVFERRSPEAHQSFLEWLNVPPSEIEAIRSRARG